MLLTTGINFEPKSIPYTKWERFTHMTNILTVVSWKRSRATTLAARWGPHRHRCHRIRLCRTIPTTEIMTAPTLGNTLQRRCHSRTWRNPGGRGRAPPRVSSGGATPGRLRRQSRRPTTARRPVGSNRPWNRTICKHRVALGLLTTIIRHYVKICTMTTIYLPISCFSSQLGYN